MTLDILVVTGGFPLRSQPFIERKVLGLAARGHRMTVLATGPGDHPLGPEAEGRLHMVGALAAGRWRRAIQCGVEVLSASGRDPRFMAALWGAARWRGLVAGAPLAGRRPDLVHVEWATKAVARLEALELMPGPLVVSCRGSDVRVIAPADPEFAARLRRLFARADAVHCVSAAIVEAAVALGLDRAKAFVNHPGVDINVFTPRPDLFTRPPAPGPRPVRIVSVGRAHWVKGYEYALQAVSLLVERGCDVRYSIIGDGDAGAMAALRFTVRDLGLSDRVDLVGARTPAQVRHVLAHSHVFLLPSVSEGLSNAVLEAMAMGLPVVVTDVGGMTEAVTDGVEGYVVGSRDPVGMADALQRLVIDEGRRTEMGAAGRRRVCASFTIDRQVDRFVEEYQRLVAPRGPA